jgi:hypothetical protein
MHGYALCKHSHIATEMQQQYSKHVYTTVCTCGASPCRLQYILLLQVRWCQAWRICHVRAHIRSALLASYQIMTLTATSMCTHTPLGQAHVLVMQRSYQYQVLICPNAVCGHCGHRSASQCIAHTTCRHTHMLDTHVS